MVMQRWDPWSEVAPMRRLMDRMFEDAPISRMGGLMGMDLDVLEQGDDLIVKATMPGVKPEDIDVNIENGVLTIRGEVREEQEQTQGRYLHRERRYGTFARQIMLPRDVDAGACDACFEDGVLTLTLPKAQHARTQRIPIRGGGSRRMVDAGATDTDAHQGRLTENKAETSGRDTMSQSEMTGDAGRHEAAPTGGQSDTSGRA